MAFNVEIKYERRSKVCANVVAMFTPSQNQQPLKDVANNFKKLVLKARFDARKVTHHFHRVVSDPIKGAYCEIWPAKLTNHNVCTK